MVKIDQNKLFARFWVHDACQPGNTGGLEIRALPANDDCGKMMQLVNTDPA